MQVSVARSPHPRGVGPAGIVVALIVVALVAALITRMAFAYNARELLAVDFIPIRRSVAQALEILLHNGVKALAFGTFCGCVKLAGQGEVPSRMQRLILLCCDGIVCAWWLSTALLAGVLIGAYGSRQALAFLPNGPVEIVAWALLIALYVDVRRGRVSTGQLAARLCVVLALLALSAVLELWAGR